MLERAKALGFKPRDSDMNAAEDGEGSKVEEGPKSKKQKKRGKKLTKDQEDDLIEQVEDASKEVDKEVEAIRAQWEEDKK